MDTASLLHTVDIDRDAATVAQRFLGEDPRVRFIFADALGWLESHRELSFDLIFADTMPGKFERFEAVGERLRPGGLHVTDDMLPQKNWPDGHGERVAGLLARLERWPECILVEMAWSSGLAIAAKSAYRPRGPHRQ